MCIAKGFEDKLCVSSILTVLLTSALAICPETFDPFLPGEAALISEIALMANLFISLFPDPTAPLVNGSETPHTLHAFHSLENNDLILPRPPHIVISPQSHSEDVGVEPFFGQAHTTAVSRRLIVHRRSIVLRDIVLQ